MSIKVSRTMHLFILNAAFIQTHWRTNVNTTVNKNITCDIYISSLYLKLHPDKMCLCVCSRKLDTHCEVTIHILAEVWAKNWGFQSRGSLSNGICNGRRKNEDGRTQTNQRVAFGAASLSRTFIPAVWKSEGVTLVAGGREGAWEEH